MALGSLILDDDANGAFTGDCLRRDVWLIERGCHPPPGHDPYVMLDRPDGLEATAGVAVSLRTKSVLRVNLALVLGVWLTKQDCPVVPLGVSALHEVVVNAAIHGNLGIASGSLADWSSLEARDRLVAATMQDASLSARAVTVAVCWSAAGGVVAAVADEGAGYVMAEAARVGPQDRRRAAGRGLVLARAGAMVELRDGGRCTRLLFSGHAAAGPAR